MQSCPGAILRWREHPLSFGSSCTWELLADMSLPGPQPGTLPRKSLGPSERSAGRGCATALAPKFTRSLGQTEPPGSQLPGSELLASRSPRGHGLGV